MGSDCKLFLLDPVLPGQAAISCDTDIQSLSFYRSYLYSTM